jgi:hypothetical protein
MIDMESDDQSLSETLPPLTFDAERGWQARSHN